MTFTTQRLRHLAVIRASNVDKKSVVGDVPVELCNYVDVYRNEVITEEMPFMAATASPSQVDVFSLREGDVILTKDSERPDDIGVPAFVPADLPGVICGYHLSVLRTDADLLEPKFLYWSLQSRQVHDYFTVSAQGITRFALGYGDLGDTPIPLPSREEQRAIVRFLDEETTTIDALIRKKKRLLALVEEQHRSAIDSLLRSAAPQTTPLVSLKRLCPFVTSGSRGWAEHYSDVGEDFIRIGNLQMDSIDLDLSRVQKVVVPPGAEADRTKTQSGDVLVSITALIGAVGVVPSGLAGYINQHIALCRPNNFLVASRWLAYSLQSDAGQQQFAVKLYGGTKQGLGLDDVKSLEVAVPPLEIQEQIVALLDGMMGSQVRFLRATNRMINLLSEYRSALITATVSGQIDVGSAA